MGKLLKGIGNVNEIKKFYDEWSDNYDSTLKKWNYKAPSHSCNILKTKVKTNPKYLLDLACGTGLFAEEVRKYFPKCICDGCDISGEILKISKTKKIYRNLYKKSFEKKINSKNKYDLVSLIGAMTYCADHICLFNLVNDYLIKGGLFIFTQRTDLWDRFNFDSFIDSQKKFKKIYKSRPLNYLPLNKDFTSKIKIRVVLLKKF